MCACVLQRAGAGAQRPHAASRHGAQPFFDDPASECCTCFPSSVESSLPALKTEASSLAGPLFCCGLRGATHGLAHVVNNCGNRIHPQLPTCKGAGAKHM